MYELGVIESLDFGTGWGVAISGGELRAVGLRDAFAAWVQLLYTVVETENALLNDLQVRNEPFTGTDTQLTPVKIQQLGQAHDRLIRNYIDHILGPPIE